MMSLYNRAKNFAAHYEGTRTLSHKTILKYMVLAGWEKGQYEPVMTAKYSVSGLIQKSKLQNGSPNHELLKRFASVDNINSFDERFISSELYNTKFTVIPSDSKDANWTHSDYKSTASQVDMSGVYYFIGLASQKAADPKRGLTKVFYNFFKEEKFNAQVNNAKNFIATLKVGRVSQSYFKETAQINARPSNQVITPIPNSNLG